jgi:hypothetical protein
VADVILYVDTLFLSERGVRVKKSLNLLIAVFFVAAMAVLAGLPTTIDDFFLPGSQPGQSGNLETPSKCDNCHGGYNISVEPAFNWRGSMMSQAARDPLFYACLAVANQDAAESGDLCIRCHSPAGWLEGRSSPTDASALNNNDREGVQCDFCHKLIKPTPLGINPFPDDPDYTAGTYDEDQNYLATLTDIPPQSGNGAYVADVNNAKRGPFIDADAKHQFFYSPFHSEADVCGTCHDVSNPAYARDSLGNYIATELDSPAPSFNTYDMFPIERTFSEWKFSAYNTPQGVFAPQFGGNIQYVSTCQDCHMRDVTGAGCNKPGVPVRNNLPLHDMTGGNTFIPDLIEPLFPGESSPAALDSGVQRAADMLLKAASLELSAEEQGSFHLLRVRITNETAHKLPSGYPEGRRIWVNVKAFNAPGSLVYESGAYDSVTGALTHDADLKVYEIKPGLTQDIADLLGYEAGPSFHFAVNNEIFSDNRIPPRGFTNANFEMIQSEPVGYAYPDSQYWDDTEYLIPGSAAHVEITLFYQTTSREYVEFLRDENQTNDWGTTFYNLWANNGKSAPFVMTSQFMDLTPIAGNQPPILDPIGDKSTDEGVNLNFPVTASDPDGGPPQLTAEPLPDGAGFTDNGDGSGAFDWTPDFTQAGAYGITFYATDDSGAVDFEAITVTVNNVNRPPDLDSIGDKTTLAGDLLSFAVTGYDADGDAVTLQAENLPIGASFIDEGWDDSLEKYKGIFSWIPDTSQTGVFENIHFIANDGLLSADEYINIAVNEESTFICGDANASGDVNILDITFLINYIYKGGPAPEPVVSGDVNSTGDINILDITYLINYIYKGGPEPFCPPMK